MRFSAIAVSTLLAACASAQVAFPAKRAVGLGHLKKRDDTCGGHDGTCCGTDAAQNYYVCPVSYICNQGTSGWDCCTTGQSCTATATCDPSNTMWGPNYTCVPNSSGGSNYAPANEASMVTSAAAVAASASSSAASAAAAVGSAASSATSSIAAAASSASSSIAAAASSAASAAAGTSTSSSSNSTAQPSATGPAAAAGNQLLVSAPALVLALLAGIMML